MFTVVIQALATIAAAIYANHIRREAQILWQRFGSSDSFDVAAEASPTTRKVMTMITRKYSDNRVAQTALLRALDGMLPHKSLRVQVDMVSVNILQGPEQERCAHYIFRAALWMLLHDRRRAEDDWNAALRHPKAGPIDIKTTPFSSALYCQDAAWLRGLGDTDINAASVRHLSARWIARRGNIPEAIATMREALTLRPGEPVIATELSALLRQQATWCLARGRSGKAIKWLEMALGLAPNDARPDLTWAHLVQGRRQNGRLPEAVDGLRIALKQPCEDIEVIKIWVAEARALQQPGLQIQALEMLLSRQCEDVEACKTMALLLEQQDVHRAVQAWQQALALSPTSLDIHTKLAQLYSEHLANPAAALPHAKQAGAIRHADTPHVAAAQARLGTVLMDLHDKAQAAEAFALSLELKPAQPRLRACLARLISDSQPTKAVLHLDIILAGEPTNLDVFLQKVDLLRRHGIRSGLTVPCDLHDNIFVKAAVAEHNGWWETAQQAYQAAGASSDLRAALGRARCLLQLICERTRHKKMQDSDNLRLRVFTKYLALAESGQISGPALQQCLRQVIADLPASFAGLLPDTLQLIKVLQRSLYKLDNRKPVHKNLVPASAPQILGFSHTGQIVIQDGAQLQWANANALNAAQLMHLQTNPALSVECTHKRLMPAAACAALAARLETVAYERCSPSTFCQALTQNGHFSFVVGGAVRDAMRGELAPQGDVDLATTAVGAEIYRMERQLFPWMPDPRHSKGVGQWARLLEKGVRILGKMDIASIRVAGMYQKQTALPHGEAVWPLAFGNNLPADAANRDFCCNALYFDPIGKVLLDPTGYGVADAERGWLRFASEKYLLDNITLSARYFKYRARGFKPAADDAGKTLSQVRRHAQQFFTSPQIAATLVRVAPQSFVHEAEIWQWLADIGACMDEDGCTGLLGQNLQSEVVAAYKAKNPFFMTR